MVRFKINFQSEIFKECFLQAGIECVFIEISGVASGWWAFSTKFWLFFGGLLNETPLKILEVLIQF